MKKITALLSLLLLLQSCSVYHSGSLSVEEAVATEDKVKVFTDARKYKFRKIEKEGEQLFGFAKPNSNTARKLAEFPREDMGKRLKFDISELQIEKIKLRNNSLSTILDITVPILIVATWTSLVLLFLQAIQETGPE